MNSPSDHLEVSTNDLIWKKGILYKKYSRTPFTGCSVEYHDNGQLEEKGNWKDGKLEGLSEFYDEEGNLTKTEERKDGKRIKKWELK